MCVRGPERVCEFVHLAFLGYWSVCACVYNRMSSVIICVCV